MSHGGGKPGRKAAIDGAACVGWLHPPCKAAVVRAMLAQSRRAVRRNTLTADVAVVPSPRQSAQATTIRHFSTR